MRAIAGSDPRLLSGRGCPVAPPKHAIVAFYLVRARLHPEHTDELREHLTRRTFEGLEPFGESLTRGLAGARLDPASGDVVWEEEDYCSPPLRMEREAVLDRYFAEIRVEPIRQGEGWARIAAFPPLWGRARSDTGG